MIRVEKDIVKGGIDMVEAGVVIVGADICKVGVDIDNVGGAGSRDVVEVGAGGIDELGAGVDVVEAGVFVMVQPGIGRKSRPVQISPGKLRWTPTLWSFS